MLWPICGREEVLSGRVWLFSRAVSIPTLI